MQHVYDIGALACIAGGVYAVYIIASRAILPRLNNNTGGSE